MQSAAYSWRLLRAGEFRLDGGSMFGLIPRTVWTKSVPIDELGRITVQHNVLLLERCGAGEGPKLIVLETGSGDKLDPKFRNLFAMENRSLLDALHEVDCPLNDVGLVTCTHLHFDHAGGLTRSSPTGPVATFPNARVIVQAKELSDARAGRSVMTKTYFKENYDPLQDHLHIVDSPRPFPVGIIPDRNAAPIGDVSVRETVIAPGLSVFLCPGHTWGQQAMKFIDDKGRTVVFVPDVMPTAAHVGQTYSLAYDVEPYTTLLSKSWFLAEAARHDWLLVLDHEPGNPLFRVRPDEKGWYKLQPE